MPPTQRPSRCTILTSIKPQQWVMRGLQLQRRPPTMVGAFTAADLVMPLTTAWATVQSVRLVGLVSVLRPYSFTPDWRWDQEIQTRSISVLTESGDLLTAA